MKEKRFLRTKKIVLGFISSLLVCILVAGITILVDNEVKITTAEPVAQRLPALESTKEGTNQVIKNLDEITETVIERERKLYEDLQLSWTAIEIPSITIDIGIHKQKVQEEITVEDEEVEVIDKTFEKKWDDANYENIRPTSIEVQLMNGNTKVGNPVTVTKANNWLYTWYDLPLEDNFGNVINYTVVETPIEGYESSECTIVDEKLTITNTYKRPTGEITMKWTNESKTESPIPVDVVFVLDTSLSMIDKGSTRADKLVDAVNTAIDEILSFNNYNRVSVVGFSEDGMYGDFHNNKSDASVLLELGRYKALGNDKTEYLVKGEGINYVKTNVIKEDGTAYTERTRYFEQPTYTQAGIKLGAEQLTKVTDTTVKLDENTTVKRVPVMIIVSDGEPTAFSTTYDNPTINTYPNANTNKLGSGQLKNTTAVYGYYTILTATHYKNEIAKHYNNEAKVFTIAMDIATYYGETILNPNSTKVANCATTTEADIYNGVKNTIENREISKDLLAYLNLEEDTQVKYSKVHELYTTPSMTTTAIKNPYKAVSSYNYVDKAFSGTMNTSDLEQAMIGSIISYIPQLRNWKITEEEITKGITYLPQISTTGEFSLTAGENYKYLDCNEAINDGVIAQDEKGEYYLDLRKVPADEKIIVSYTQR